MEAGSGGKPIGEALGGISARRAARDSRDMAIEHADLADAVVAVVGHDQVAGGVERDARRKPEARLRSAAVRKALLPFAAPAARLRRRKPKPYATQPSHTLHTQARSTLEGKPNYHKVVTVPVSGVTRRMQWLTWSVT